MKKNTKQYIFILLIALIIIYIIYYFYSNSKKIENKFSNSEFKKDENNINYWENNISKKNKYQKQIITNIDKNNIKEDKISKNNLYNFKVDSSIQKYVSPLISFDNIKYKPDDLIDIESKYIINSKSWMLLRKEAFENLDLLVKDFYKEFKTSIVLVSAYRDYIYQKWIETNQAECVKNNLCAKAWYSEHQTWLAIDIFEASSKDEFLSNKNYKKYFEWMKKNAYKYWFHNSYQNWIQIDWYSIEPWHWRYLWRDLAKKLNDENITFSEYYNSQK